MAKKIKVSFDFDGTLDRPEIQQYARELIGRGIEVWIVTARVDHYMFEEERKKALTVVETPAGLTRPYAPIYGYEMRKKPRHHTDVIDVADSLGIPYERVMFVGGYTEYKLEYLNGLGFAFHIDDDWYELKFFHLQKDSIDVQAVNATLSTWREDCEKILNQITND